eukprot:TRINITY_DN13700_c0_g1_i1.p1 TRINITY_DN13700_c0_g1~~TRINITY_DN13700_c0_g1_i1.p1  ORF type:complete len:198 (+),score=51.12 TRINITY_DN13700_c0_g1_i1:50-643(+)
MADETKTIYTLIVGTVATGKTSVINQFRTGQFQDAYISTIGLELRFKMVEIDDKQVKIVLFDSSGQDRFQSLTKALFRNTQAVVLVFDISDRSTFDLLPNYMDIIQRFAHPGTPVMIVANKCDLVSAITDDELSKFCLQNNVPFKKTSAKTGENVSNMFIELATTALRNQNSDGNTNNTVLLSHTKNEQDNDDTCNC